MIDDPFQPTLSKAFDSWRRLVDDRPRIARPAFFWAPELRLLRGQPSKADVAERNDADRT